MWKKETHVVLHFFFLSLSLVDCMIVHGVVVMVCSVCSFVCWFPPPLFFFIKVFYFVFLWAHWALASFSWGLCALKISCIIIIVIIITITEAGTHFILSVIIMISPVDTIMFAWCPVTTDGADVFVVKRGMRHARWRRPCGAQTHQRWRTHGWCWWVQLRWRHVRTTGWLCGRGHSGHAARTEAVVAAVCGGRRVEGGQVWLDVRRGVTHAPHARVTHVHPTGSHAPWTLAAVLQGVCTTHTHKNNVRNLDPVFVGVSVCTRVHLWRKGAKVCPPGNTVCSIKV